jgi:hypothetical protein
LSLLIPFICGRSLDFQQARPFVVGSVAVQAIALPPMFDITHSRYKLGYNQK